MIPELQLGTNGWGDICKLNRKGCLDNPDTPMMRSDPINPDLGDQLIVGMYVKAAGVVAWVELENKFGIVDFKVTFCKMHPTDPDDYTTVRYERLADAVHDFCQELMLDNPLYARSNKLTMQQQYSENTGFGTWA